MRVLAFLLASCTFTPLVTADTVLLDFTADWCGPCREMAPIVAGLEREGYRVERVNVDQNRAKAQQFHVASIPTFVVLTDGRETARLVGAADARGPIDANRLRQLLGPVNAKRPQAASAKPAPETAVALSTQADAPAGNELIRRSVRVVIEDSNSKSFGTGSVIRSVPGETLVVSCAHMFDGISRNAKTTVEFFGAAEPLRLPGELVARDRAADVSLLRVSTREPLPTAPIASRRFVPARGLRASSVGCDNGNRPTARQVRISDVNRYVGAPTIECTGQPVQGRSGGGLFNESAELIGVCSAADPGEHKGIYAGLAAIHSLLERQGLAGLFDSPAPRDLRVVPASLSEKPKPGSLSVPLPHELGLKIGSEFSLPDSAAGAEAVCVIRANAAPQAPPRVIVLNKLSPELLARLEKEEASQGTRAATSMRLPNRPDWRPVLKQPAPQPAPAPSR